MAAAALFAVSRGLELASGINSAFQEQAYAQLQQGLIERQMEEIDARARLETQAIERQSEKIVSTQQAAFISGGVELSGSAMSVVSDTMNDAAQAAFISRRQADYDLENLALQRQQQARAASNETLMLKIASSAIGAGAGGIKDYASYKKGAPGNAPSFVDQAGGTTSYSTDYLNM